jgi:hypothetical protein
VFKLTPGLGSAWTETILYSFTGGGDGAFPNAPLIMDSLGNLYGAGGAGGALGIGVVFEVLQ